ncbi:hypothetical protein E2562_037145 [Oryza meyeriana var. granulata]|uniref:Uncharacterized protein n=1 Tax=Oryza meyeriana var. granulata TaxID=110450 RepID=A0A6G1CW16_9ORYZ|nr:hypothetical protein E2562_037145 [Oryza meyeriana var. granulata]
MLSPDLYLLSPGPSVAASISLLGAAPSPKPRRSRPCRRRAPAPFHHRPSREGLEPLSASSFSPAQVSQSPTGAFILPLLPVGCHRRRYLHLRPEPRLPLHPASVPFPTAGGSASTSSSPWTPLARVSLA